MSDNDSNAPIVEKLSARNVRRALPADADAIRRLADADTEWLFGHRDITEIILTSCTTLVIETTYMREIIACVSLHSHPNLPAPPSWEWEAWLGKLYHLKILRPWNTRFVHYAVWSPAYSATFLRTLMASAYADAHHLEFVVLIQPPGALPTGKRLDWLEKYALRLFPKGGATDATKTQTMHLMRRETFTNRYKIRKAVEEDNDDLVPLIGTHCKLLGETYGAYYVAELLRDKSKTRQIIVAEHKGLAVAVCVLNYNVNSRTLNEQFELAAFKGLKKSAREDEEEEENTDEPAVTPSDDFSLNTIYNKADVLSDSDFEMRSTTFDSTQTSFDAISRVDMDDDVSFESTFSLNLLDGDESRVRRVKIVENGKTERTPDEVASILQPRSIMDVYDTQRGGTVTYEAIRSSSKTTQTPPPPNPTAAPSHGTDNAFVLEVAASHPDHEDTLNLLLEAAFQCFPGRDYCVLTLPSTVDHFPLLGHFVRVPPRPYSNYPHEMYVLHRNAISGTLEMRPVARRDVGAAIRGLVEGLQDAAEMLEGCEKSLREDGGNEYMAFVVENDGRCVGLIVVSELTQLAAVTSAYDLSRHVLPHVHKTHGTIRHFALMPAFHQHIRFLMRELHRLTDCDVLHYSVTPDDARQRCVINCLALMTPVTSTTSSATDEPSSHFCSTMWLCSAPIVHVNARLVVVGSSDCALAFLYALLYAHSDTYRVLFNNVTLVSPHGLSYERPPHRVRDAMFVRQCVLSREYLRMNNLRCYVNVVCGVLTGIDRKERQVEVNGVCHVSYDRLFLFCGEQYQMFGEKRWMREMPENVFVVNTETDADRALDVLDRIMEESVSKTVIVYGHNFESYCCVAALLARGHNPADVVLVEPFPVETATTPPHQYAFFNDAEIDGAVRAELKAAGVVVLDSCKFNDWTYSRETRRVTDVEFVTKYKLFEIDCGAMFVYGEKMISKTTFLALIKAGLVFDGLLVIQPDCRTNDPRIYSAGTMTKYSRRFYADHMSHRYYNSYEIGRSLGRRIRSELIGRYDDATKEESTLGGGCRTGKLAEYVSPVFKQCLLPRRLHYVCVRKPGIALPGSADAERQDYGVYVATGDLGDLSRQGYFKLHVNSYNTVETITCLAPFKIDGWKLYKLWGKHVKLLNNVLERYKRGYIVDLFAYFDEPWASAIYHEKFTRLEESIRDLVTSTVTSDDGQENSFVGDLRAHFEGKDWKKVTKEQVDWIRNKFVGSYYHEKMEQLVVEYLQENVNKLPMYATPILVKMLLQTGLQK